MLTFLISIDNWKVDVTVESRGRDVFLDIIWIIVVPNPVGDAQPIGRGIPSQYT